MIQEVELAPDSPLEEAGFELVWGFSCQVVVFGLLQFFVRSGKGRSSFFNRAPGVKKVIHFGLRKTVSSARWGTPLAKCCFFVSAEGRFSVPACRSTCEKGHLCGIGSGLSR